MRLLHRKPPKRDAPRQRWESEHAFEDRRARELGYDPDACARGDHPWYVSWGFCANPFCEALMPGLVRGADGQPMCPECGVVTTSGRPHRSGCTIGTAYGYVLAERARP